MIEHILSALNIPSVRWHKPILIGIFGLPGAGKTEVARYLAYHHHVCVLSTDAIPLRYGFESGLATRRAMDQVAAQLLTRHAGVVLDGIHLARKDRLAVQQVADAHQASVCLIYVVADAAIIEQRLQERMQRPESVASEGKFVITPEHFAHIASYLEPPTADERMTVVDTSHNRLDDQLVNLNQLLRHNFLGRPLPTV